MPRPLANAGAAASPRRIALAGGTAAGGPTSEVAFFEAASGWLDAPGLPAPVARPGAAVLQGTLWVLGGQGERGWTAGAHALDPAFAAWADRPPLPEPARLPVALAIRHELHVFCPQTTDRGARLVVQTWHGPAVFYVLRQQRPGESHLGSQHSELPPTST